MAPQGLCYTCFSVISFCSPSLVNTSKIENGEASVVQMYCGIAVAFIALCNTFARFQKLVFDMIK